LNTLDQSEEDGLVLSRLEAHLEGPGLPSSCLAKSPGVTSLEVTCGLSEIEYTVMYAGQLTT